MSCNIIAMNAAAKEFVKTDEFSDFELMHLADKFKLLSEPSRLKIIRSVFGGEKTVGSICEETGLLQANVSKQLKTLTVKRVLKCRAEGVYRYYSVSDDKIKQICSIVCGKYDSSSR